MEWPFPESEKYFSEPKFPGKCHEIPQKERFSPNFRLQNSKIQSPKKCNSIPKPLHTPTRLPPIFSPNVNVISPKVNPISPRVNAYLPKSKRQVFLGNVFEEFEVFETFCWGGHGHRGVKNI